MNNKATQMQGFLSKASAIMNRVEEIAPKAPSKGQPTLSESMRIEGVGGVDYSDNTNNPYYEQEYATQQNSFTQSAKKLPASILESIQQNPIQEYQGQMGGLSVLDGIMPPQQSRQPRQQVNESYEYGEKQMPTTEELFRNKAVKQEYNQPTYQPQQPIGGQIDYSLINSMIKTAISEEIQKLKRVILTENKQTSSNGDVIIKVGNGIQFITNNGNVYEGKVKLVGNLKDK